ncbi:MAG: FtsX-like permease family protein [Acidimicrobiia bacterium]
MADAYAQRQTPQKQVGDTLDLSRWWTPATLARRLGGVLATVVLIAAFLVTALLTLSSVTKRVRELGTLKAIGWRRSLVVRQVIGESVVQGVLGGLLGISLGVLAAVAGPTSGSIQGQVSAHHQGQGENPGDVDTFAPGSAPRLARIVSLPRRYRSQCHPPCASRSSHSPEGSRRPPRRSPRSG